MSKRAVIYGRVSTDLQRDNYSIPSQVAECLKYIKQRGYSLVGNQFVDPETGLDTIGGNGAIPAYVDDYTSRELSRPSLDAAISYLETVGYDVLVVYALDRLARDPYIRETLEREFSARDAKVEFVLGDYEDTPTGDVRKDLDATFAKWENAMRVERTNRGKIRKAESGLFVTGITPYGYVRDDNALGGLAVDEEQAEIVRRIFRMYAEDGLSINAIVDRLNEETVPSYNDRWAKTTVIRLLKNTVYIGKLYYNRTKYKDRKPREIRDKSKWVEIPTTPLIEDWLFDAAQQRFKENRRMKKRQPKRFYLLSGMIVCGDCSRSYVSQTYKAGKQRRKTDGTIYRHRVSAGHCMNRQVRANVIEPLVWEAIVKLLKDPQQLRMGYEESLEQQNSSRKRQLSYLGTLKKRAVKVEQTRQNLTAAYLDPDVPLSKSEYIVQKTRYDDELKSIAEEIKDVEKELADIPSPAELETLETFAQEICSRLDIIDPSPEQKRKILELLHVKVIIELDGEVRLDGWFNPLEQDNEESTSEPPIGGGNGKVAKGSMGLLDRQSPCREDHRQYLPPPRPQRRPDRSQRKNIRKPAWV